MLYLALIPGKNIGWGVCSTNLIKELSSRHPCEVIPKKIQENEGDTAYPGPVFHAIGDHHLEKFLPVTGEKNFGYTFFENLIPEDALERARFYDLIFTGSTWCKERLEEKGIKWTKTLIQGVSPDIFYPLPIEKPSLNDLFVVFSGGKFELRKGQDLVIRAVKILQDRHKDVIFINLWANSWRFSMDTMAQSPYIRYHRKGTTWKDIMCNILQENGMDLSRIVIGDKVEQHDLKDIYAVTDVGIFPNRCEGGTNLVLMEYMASARPVIASYNTGHQDILTQENALLVKNMKNMEIHDPSNGRLNALWKDPDLDELIWNLEDAYQKRDKLKETAIRAGEDMKKWTWARSAEDFLKKIV